ncbi:MAG: geranylgeranylglyceryl/heptaprenylglyceryl phosphate synthase [Flavobacteriales bacterium]
MNKLNLDIYFNEKSKKLAILVDPDRLFDEGKIISFIQKVNASSIDLILFGGSLLTTAHFDLTLSKLKANLKKPLIIFPGHHIQISKEADGLLFLSLISGRNADFLIGQHVVAAPFIKSLGISVIPTGYILVDGGKPTTASYISNTTPIPNNKPEIAASTAIAGELLGLKLIYLDAGSGAEIPVSEIMISKVKENTTIPLIVGGGIRDLSFIQKAWNAGADCVVVGTAIEENEAFFNELTKLKGGLT